MNNFDLRKYLAEGKLKVNEGDTDRLMQDLERKLMQHDWFYYMADDSKSYNKGELEEKEIEKLLKMLDNSPEAIALYNKFAPVQDGIDMRIKEGNKRPDYPDVDKDGDTEESMEKALKDKEENLKEWGSSDWHYFLDAMHTDLGKPTDAPDIFKVLDVAADAVDKYWDDWEEYETDYEGLKMDAAQTYLKTKFPEYFKGMQALFAPMNEESIKESLRAWNVIDIDGNVTHEGLSYEEALAKAKEVEGHKIRPTNMMLEEEDYDPDQEQLDDEDEIFMPMDDEGRPLEEAINPEVVRAVNRLIKGLAKKYDYSDRDAVYAIVAALREEGYSILTEGYYGSSDIDNIASTLGYDDTDSFFNDNPGAVDAVMQWAEMIPDFEKMLQDAGMIEEDLDLGHQDNEPHMLKSDLYRIGKYAMELYQMVDEFDGEGEVDFPHWWQSKVIKAKDALVGAKHYLDFELKEPTVDAMVTEDSLEDQAKIYFMQKVKSGEIDELPEDPTAEFVAQMTKDQIEHDQETLDSEMGLEEETFFTKDVKDAVISKLMDQLKK